MKHSRLLPTPRAARRLVASVAALGVATLTILGPEAGNPAAALCGPEGCNYEEPGSTKPHRPGSRAARIVTIGDSYASGEGAPDVQAWSGTTVWQDPNCHRSGFAPAARAVGLLRATNPYEEGIDFLSVACSGAGIRDGVLQGQAGKNIPSQIAQVNTAVGTRRIDILNIGIGGNDLDFAGLLSSCIFNVCPTAANTEAFNRGIAQLPGRYDELINAVQGDSTGAGRRLQAPVTKVFITKYPGPMRNAKGGYCHRAPADDATENITAEESRWGTETVVARLNASITAMAARANARPGTHPTWVVVEAPGFMGNGFCAGASRWINTFSDSAYRQNDQVGTLHPNYDGTHALGRNLYDHFAYINA